MGPPGGARPLRLSSAGGEPRRHKGGLRGGGGGPAWLLGPGLNQVLPCLQGTGRHAGGRGAHRWAPARGLPAPGLVPAAGGARLGRGPGGAAAAADPGDAPAAGPLGRREGGAAGQVRGGAGRGLAGRGAFRAGSDPSTPTPALSAAGSRLSEQALLLEKLRDEAAKTEGTVRALRAEAQQRVSGARRGGAGPLGGARPLRLSSAGSEPRRRTGGLRGGGGGPAAGAQQHRTGAGEPR